jgi:hypothetical protein
MYSDLALELVYYPANNEYPNVNFFYQLDAGTS